MRLAASAWYRLITITHQTHSIVLTFDTVGIGGYDRRAADARADKSDDDEGDGDNRGSYCRHWLLLIDCGGEEQRITMSFSGGGSTLTSLSVVVQGANYLPTMIVL